MKIASSVIAILSISTFLTLVLPIIALVFLGILKKISVKPMLIGAAAFFVSQLLLRLPILQMLDRQAWFHNFAINNIILYIVLIGGFTAGLFEESARYISASAILKNQRSYRDAISFGLGHGLCEVVFLVGLTQLNNLITSIMIQNGSFDTIAKTLPAGTADKLIAQLGGVTASVLFFVVLERISAVLFHLFATVLVFKGVNEHKIRYYFFAILAHTVLNSLAGILVTHVIDVVLELIVFAVTLCATIYTVKAKQSFKNYECNNQQTTANLNKQLGCKNSVN